MKKLFDYIARKVWNEIGSDLTEGIATETSLKAVYAILSEDFGEEFAEQYIKSLLEAKGVDGDEPTPGDEKELENEKWGMMTQGEKDAYKEKKKSQEELDEAKGGVQSVLNSKVTNPDTGRQIKVSSGLSYDNNTGGYQAAKSKMKDAGVSDDEIEKVSDDNTDDKKQTKSKSEPQSNGYVGDKDKSLKQGDPRESEVYQMELPPDDAEFEEKNKKFANPNPPEPYKMPDFLNDNPKFPKKYTKALERMLNTQPKGDATKWGHFSDIEGGAGQISAQAGELMTMMGSTMSDEEWDEFSNSVLKHDEAFNEANPKLKDAKHKIVDKSWVTAATQSRKAIKDRLTKQYGEGVEIVAGAWDNKSDVESMGMSDYNENKGFSTDMYLKVKLPNGEEVLDEVSLKKSTYVNFLNSGAGSFLKWDPNLPDEINQNVYAKKAKERNTSYVSNNVDKINELLKTPEGAAIAAVLKSKKFDSVEQILDPNTKGASRDKQKVLWTVINALANSGDTSAKEIVDRDEKEHLKFQADSIKAITENPKMKEGMLNTIKNEFPLKAVSDGEETMAIGPNSLDKKTMKAIFGTDDYNKLKENLVAEPPKPIIDPKTGKPKLDKNRKPKMSAPYIGYKIETSGEVFAIADIVIREDGRGYGGQFKFEMQLNQKSFAKRLKQAQADVYNK
jgi:hypothetical protein